MGGLKINADAEILDTQGNVIPGLYAAGETTGGTQSAGPYELRLPIFLQPLGGALKNRSAAPASPPCFRRRRRSAPLLFKSRARLNKKSSTQMCTGFFKSEQRDLNPRPPRPERGALPTALSPENTAASCDCGFHGWG